MTVEVDDGDGTVSAMDGPQYREGNRVVASQGYDPRQRLTLLRGTGLLGVSRRGPGQDSVVAFLYLLYGERVVVSRVVFHQLLARDQTASILSLYEYPHEVTGISPQSRTLAHPLNGFVSRGTLYPPLEYPVRVRSMKIQHLDPTD